MSRRRGGYSRRSLGYARRVIPARLTENATRRIPSRMSTRSQAWAATIAGYSPAAVQATKRLATFSRRSSEAERSEIEAVRAMVETHDDYKEGAAAFSGRR